MGGSMSQIEFAKDKDGNVIQTTLDKITFATNTEDDMRLEHIKSSIRRQLPQAHPHEEQDQIIAIVCGGPSLKETFDDLKEKYDNGMKVVSLNGTHDWLMERGIRPSVHIQLDARQFNSRFVKNWHKDTKYYIAAQSHPDVFDALDGANTTLFHCYTNKKELKLTSEYYMGHFVPIMGGTTVTLRAIPLMKMLGFRKMEIFGFDSCCIGDEHHSYIQEENNIGTSTTIELDGEEFFCYGWMYKQATDFIEMVSKIGDEFELLVHGNGLIAHILKTGAARLEEK